MDQIVKLYIDFLGDHSEVQWYARQHGDPIPEPTFAAFIDWYVAKKTK